MQFTIFLINTERDQIVQRYCLNIDGFSVRYLGVVVDDGVAHDIVAGRT